jgi:large subunit ribosomal protein L15
MMEHEVRAPSGARRPRRRVGRGDASGKGSYSGRGMKGQKARAGKGPRPGYEGGQLPLIKKLPARRGFVNLFRTEYQVVNLRSLEAFSGDVTPQTLASAGLVKDAKALVKVLGGGELTKPLTVAAHRFSASARQKIEAAGGTVKELV